ncbi:MAG: Rrf2 family transcriptional regulator [Anaerolineales bacterium]|nr:Rrf2 family transcriptional regulator [Anaerolineales bacterium]
MMVELGMLPQGECLSSRRMSRRTSVPKAFLHKITADLVKANMVNTFAGPTGGLALAQPAVDITLLQIVEAIEGPLCMNPCLLRPHECPRDLICPAHTFWGRLQALVVAELRGVTLAELVAEARLLQQNPSKQRLDISYLLVEGEELPPQPRDREPAGRRAGG